jgi:hypothetical protein
LTVEKPSGAASGVYEMPIAKSRPLVRCGAAQ